MMSNLPKVLENISIWLIYALAIALPVVFTNLTTEFYETSKFLILASLVLIIFLIWGVRFLIMGKVELPKTPLDLFLILFLLVAIISTIVSPSRYTAIFGSAPKIHGSLLYIIVLTLFYFLVVFCIKNIKQAALAVNLMISSGVILSLFSLLTYFKVQSNIPLTGSLESSSIYLAMILPLSLKMLFSKNPIGIVINLLFAVTLLLVGSWPAWIGALFAVVVTLYSNQDNFRKVLPGISTIAAVVIMLAFLSFAPVMSGQTLLSRIAKNTVREAQLPLVFSWKISAGTFRDSPLWGSGPATYLYDFTQYKPLEYNQTAYWNLRQSSAHNHYLQTLAEVGGAGIFLLLAITISFIIYALKNPNPLNINLAGVTFFLLMATSPMNILTQTAGFLILALTFASRENQENYEINLGSGGGLSHPLIPSLMLLPILAISVSGFYFIGKFAFGEYYHRQALNSVSQNQALPVYNQLILAEKANPYIDLYRIDLAQTNFALANAIATQKGPTEASPSGSLTDQDKTNIQSLLQQAIAEGRAAVTLSPRSAANWEVLASIYRQISGVAENGLQFSLNSYGRAIQLDPLNPLLRMAVGGIYYQLKNYDLAVRFFDDAVSLKPDHANALYNLAVALREKGLYREGVLVAERLVVLLSKDTSSKDYQLASEMLKELKEKTPPPPAGGIQPTTASPSATLENQNLPKVLDLPKPENIATPPAVKK